MNKDKEIMKKMGNNFEELTIEDIEYIVETTGIRFLINDGKVSKVVYNRI